MEEKKFQKSDCVFLEGDLADRMYIVKQGDFFVLIYIHILIQIVFFSSSSSYFLI